jgi:hypothetical protein
MNESSHNVDFRELLPRLKGHWSGSDVDEWIAIEGNLEYLVGYARILWPEFVEHDECVFMTEHFSEKNYQDFMRQTGQDKTAVETVMNHVHILDLFNDMYSEPKPTRELILYVGRLIKETWLAKLKRDFPNRKVTVSFPEQHCDDLMQYEVSFFQER